MDKIKIVPEYAKSKKEIWKEKFEHLEQPKRKKVFFKKVPLWAYAASFLVLLLLVCNMYTVTIETTKGEHKELKLPDSSILTMNAESKISYKPFKWYFSRKVELEGEACFDVKRGDRFLVKTGLNRVNVLGTTFNVCARTGLYSVTCIEGRVEVIAENEQIVLTSNMQASLRAHKLTIKNGVTSSDATGWKQGRFMFDDTPLQEVIAEVERQFNIKVNPKTYPNYLYSGNFLKLQKPEEILEIIGLPFGINFSIE